MIYLVFNEATRPMPARSSSAARFARKAFRLGRLLLRLFQTEREIMGL